MVMLTGGVVEGRGWEQGSSRRITGLCTSSWCSPSSLSVGRPNVNAAPSPLAHPFLLKTMLGQLLWGIPPKYTSQCLLPEAQSHGKLLTTRPLSQVEDCPGLGAHTLAEGKQGPAGACCKGWRRGEVSDPPHVTGS